MRYIDSLTDEKPAVGLSNDQSFLDFYPSGYTWNCDIGAFHQSLDRLMVQQK